MRDSKQLVCSYLLKQDMRGSIGPAEGRWQHARWVGGWCDSLSALSAEVQNAPSEYPSIRVPAMRGAQDMHSAIVVKNVVGEGGSCQGGARWCLMGSPNAGNMGTCGQNLGPSLP
jgi:hypothetical protein